MQIQLQVLCISRIRVTEFPDTCPLLLPRRRGIQRRERRNSGTRSGYLLLCDSQAVALDMAVASRSPTLPVVPLTRQAILFPSLVLRVSIDRADTSSLLSDLVSSGKPNQFLACVPLRPEALQGNDLVTSSLDELRTKLGDYGCMGKLLRVERNGSSFVAVVEGMHRVKLVETQMKGSDEIHASVTHYDNKAILATDTKAQAKLANLKASSSELITTLQGLKLPSVLIHRLELFISKSDYSSAGQLCDLMVSVVESTYAEKVAVLQCVDISDRLQKVHELVSKQLNTIKVSRKISSSVDQSLNKQQKEFILRQKLNAIKKELGQLNGDGQDEDADEDDYSEYRKKIDAARLSVEAKAVAEKELKRLKRMQPQQAEYQVIRTYLDNILEIPWLKTSQSETLEAKSIADARRILDEDHFGLEKVKKRLVEYLAILRLRQTLENERSAEVRIDSKL